MPEDRYTHGHHASVVGAHATRTIANSAAYLQDFLVPGASLLDVGCGPGSITAEFAERLGPGGSVLGIDASAAVIELASQTYASSTAQFEVMDLYQIDAADDTFDIVHAHQVLQHVSDPVTALKEMARVAKPGGIVAVRDADYDGMHWAPRSPGLESWLQVYRDVAYRNDAEPDAGRHLLRWARQAGLSDVAPSLATWLFADPDGREWWGSTWAARVVSSSFAEQAVEYGLASTQDMHAMSAAWTEWLADADGWFVVPHGQLICTIS